VRVATKAYGEVEADERQRLVFPGGLIGFEGFRDFLLLDAERQPFYWLQSMDSQRVAFVLVSPFLFRPDFEVNLGSEELAEMGLSSPEQALVFSTVTVPPDGGAVTANLQGPLVINRDTRIGRQVILSDPRWGTRHDIMAELAASQDGAPC